MISHASPSYVMFPHGLVAYTTPSCSLFLQSLPHSIGRNVSCSRHSIRRQAYRITWEAGRSLRGQAVGQIQFGVR